jgi:hypothetical protein
MAKIRVIKVDDTHFKYVFVCPACNCHHAFDERWEFNHDLDKPTISPSFKQTGFIGFNKDGDYTYGTCHSFIKEGMIEYCGDCTHDMKNQKVELPEIQNTHTNEDTMIK